MIEARRATGRLEARHGADRADLRQHRHRARLRLRRQGLRLILTMPESMSMERRKMLAAPGRRARADPGRQGHAGAIAPRRGAGEGRIPNVVMPQQFANPANPEIHRHDHGRGDLARHRRQGRRRSISGVGTGGTITGVGQVLKPRKPGVRMVAVEPEDSPVLSGGQPGAAQDPGHRRGLRARHPRHRGDRRSGHDRQRNRLRHRAPGRQDRGHAGRHLVGRRAGGGA